MSVLLVCYISSPAHTKRKTFCSHDDDDHNVYFEIIFLFEFYFFIYLVKSSFILISVFRVPLFWVGAETWGWLWVTQVPLYYMYLIHLIHFIFCLIEGRYCGGGCYLCFILCCASLSPHYQLLFLLLPTPPPTPKKTLFQFGWKICNLSFKYTENYVCVLVCQLVFLFVGEGVAVVCV